MKIGFRVKLFLGSVALALLVVGLSGLYLQRSLRGWGVARAHAELTRHVEAARVALRHHPTPHTPARLDPLADELAEATGAHVEILDARGAWLGDSARPTDELAGRAPLPARQLARWRRRHEGGAPPSPRTRLKARSSLALARPWGASEGGEPGGWVRLTLPLSELEAMVGRARLLMLVAAGLGLAAAVLMSWLAAHLMSRTLRRLVDHAHSMARGAGSDLELEGHDELGGRALSITRLAEELTRSVEVLARERDRFSAVLESMSEAVIALDDQQRVQLINRTAQDFFASQLQVFDGVVEGQRVTSMIRIPALLDLLEEAGRGKASAAEINLSGPPPRRVMAHVTPRPGGGGSVLVMHDVTELRKLETIRRDFVANVSHELRTPVSVIMLNAETLLGDDELMDDNPQARRFLDGLFRNAERLSRLISDLLDISRLEAGRFRLELEPISVLGATLRVLDVLEEHAQRKHQTLEADIDVELLVFADAKALDQMLFNLVDNAIKYAPERGRVTVRAALLDDQLDPDGRPFIRIEICDDGPGLPAEHHPRIFERFYRVDDGRSRDVGGTGLGLAIVKHLAMAMGGRVGVRSNEPQGSIFWIRLPQAHDDDEVEIDLAQALDVVPRDPVGDAPPAES